MSAASLKSAETRLPHSASVSKTLASAPDQDPEPNAHSLPRENPARLNSDAQDPGGSLIVAILQMSGFGGSNVKLEDDAIADLLTKAARKEAKRKKKEAKLLKRKLEGVAKARAARREQAARDRAFAAEYRRVRRCPKCSLPTVSRGGMVFCSKAWAPVHSNGGLYDEQFYPGGAHEEGGTGCGWSETPVKGAGEATCKRCGSTETRTHGGSGGWDGFWWKRECDNPHCGYGYYAAGVYR